MAHQVLHVRLADKKGSPFMSPHVPCTLLATVARASSTSAVFHSVAEAHR